MDKQVMDGLNAVRESQQRTEVHIAEIKKDIEHHIARTDANETRIVYLERVFIGLASVAVLGGIVKILIS